MYLAENLVQLGTNGAIKKIISLRVDGMTNTDVDFARVFAALGFEGRIEADSNEITGECPFCRHKGKEGKKNYFYVNRRTGLWDCKFCNENGNLYSIMTRFARQWYDQTPPEKWAALSKTKGIPVDAFKRYRWCWNGSEWCVPVWNPQGTFVRNIYRFDDIKNKMLALPQPCEHQLIGQDDLAKASKGAVIWLCEGQSDVAAWRWMLDQAGRKSEFTVAVPGAGVFKENKWAKLFAGMKVRMIYDNDVAGDNGSMKVSQKLNRTVAEMKFVCWPETLKTGYDIRDYVRAAHTKREPPVEVVGRLEKFLSPMHRRAKDSSPTLKALDPLPSNPGPLPGFDAVTRTFAKWLKINEDFKAALAGTLAVCLSNQVPGDPIWLYIVGPPSSGKTVIVAAMKDSERVLFHSSVTAKSLVSGFTPDDGSDPSLLSKVNDKTLIFKDGTELLALRPDERRAVYSILRGSYDGTYHFEYANGTVRSFPTHFNLLIAVTGAVRGDQQSAMGERFLTVEMSHEVDYTHSLDTAIDNITHEVEMQEELSAVCRRFLERTVDAKALPDIPAEWKIKIKALAQFVAMLRAQVEREKFGDRDMLYKPFVEAPHRLAKQLGKLARMLAIVYGKKSVDREVYSLVRKIGFDSCITFHMDMAQRLLRENRTLTTKELAETLKLPMNFLQRRLEDMSQLGIVVRVHDPVQRQNAVGPKPWRWQIVDRVRVLWQQSKVWGNIK